MTKAINEFGEQVVTMALSERGPLTEEELKMIHEARSRTPVYDEDCLPMPEAMHRQIQMEIAKRKAGRRQVIV